MKMSFPCGLFVCTVLALFSASAAQYGRPISSSRKIVVDQSGKGQFKTIQAAINSVPSNNKQWITINVKKGLYKEQVSIPREKTFIYLKGEGEKTTRVEWDAHESIATSATFSSYADNIIINSITFVNSYNSQKNTQNPVKAALAAKIQGDKSAFYKCGFISLQDTLWDVQGRHYFKQCTIEGAVDFIFGSGQSIYEKCSISVVAIGPNTGYITAQGRSNPQESNGFVFNDCNIYGQGKTYLGRPWRGYATVLFYNTSMSEVIVPPGWEPWYNIGHEDQLTFAEHNCRGKGSNTTNRVKWVKKLSDGQLKQLTSISFIDGEGWLKRLPWKV